MTPVTVKLTCTSDPKAPWLATARAVALNRFIEPGRLPAAVREQVRQRGGTAYFTAAVEVETGRITFGGQVKGEKW